MSIEIIKEGFKYWGDSELDGGRNYMILKSDKILNEDIVRNFLENKWYDIDGYSSGIPGGQFAKPAWIRVYGKKAIITQNVGWDV
jgi:hypothetical protein